MTNKALEELAEAQTACDSMMACASTEDWEQLAPLDKQCRESIERALDGYAELNAEEQRQFREKAGWVLETHREILKKSQQYLSELRSEVQSSLSSKKASQSYLKNS